MRVCVIGNSMVGALARACIEEPVAGYDFQFFARATKTYEALRFEGTILHDVAFSTTPDTDMAHYDTFVIYGDVPPPHTTARQWRSLSTGSYSRQVRQAAFHDWLHAFKSMRLAWELHDRLGKPIFCLSMNRSYQDKSGTPDEMDEGVRLLAEAMAPFGYIPHPDGLLGPDGHPDPAYHVGSLDVRGEEPDRTIKPLHHYVHFNRRGGALIRDQIVAWLGRS